MMFDTTFLFSEVASFLNNAFLLLDVTSQTQKLLKLPKNSKTKTRLRHEYLQLFNLHHSYIYIIYFSNLNP